MRLAVLLIVALCCSPALGADLDTLHRQVAASANDIFPIHLHTLVLLPAAVVKRVGKVHLGQLDLEGPVHQVDAISAFVQEYSNLGGVNGNLDVLVSDSHSKNMVKQRAMSFVSRGMTDVGDHDRRGPGDSTAEVETYSNIQNCISHNEFGFSFEKNEEGYAVSHAGTIYQMTENEFEADLVQFFTQACAMIELAHNQGRIDEQSGLILELDSATKLMNSRFSTSTGDILSSLLRKFDATAQKVFGATATATHVATYTADNLVRESSSRILQQTTDSDAYMYTIKYVFTIVFSILILLICIDMYTMEIYKDSLIYAKFLVKKTN